MTEATLKKALELKKKIGDCKQFCDDLMRMRRDQSLTIKVDGDGDSCELTPSIYCVNEFIGIMGNEIDRLQKEFNELK